MQTPLVIKQGTSTGQLGMQPGMVTVPMSVSSSIPGSISNVMTINKPGGQNVVVTTQNLGSGQSAILPNVQILNMRPGAPSIASQKSVATVSPRVVMGNPQVVGTRAAAPSITLQTLQSLQQQGHLLLKTENGQYQLLRVGPAPVASTLSAPHPQTLRLSTVPAHPGVATLSTSVASPTPIPSQMPQGSVATQVPVPVATMPKATLQPPQPTVTTQKPLDNTKEKCRNFLANLLDLSSKEPKSVERNVRNLIQELIDAQVEPEEFCDRLERLLNASPQPCLIGFLKKSLPLLRQSLIAKELVIEGIIPPSPHVAFSTLGPPAPQVVAATNVQMLTLSDEEGEGPTFTPLLTPELTASLMPPPIYTLEVLPSTSTVQQKPPPKAGSMISVLQNIPVHKKIIVSKVGKTMTVNSNFTRPAGSSAGLSTILTLGKSHLKDKEKKSAMQFAQPPYIDDKMAGDDDINDVAAMGGVNLAEESQRILGSTGMIGTQIRSCKDECVVPISAMLARINECVAERGLQDSTTDVAALMCHAVHERLKTIVEKLVVVAQHRLIELKSDPRYEVTQDVKGQLKFLEDLDRVEQKKREDSEREILLRAAKSRSKNEDSEQAKLKAKAKEMQRAELEELRQRESNLTALLAIGPRKKPRLEGSSGGKHGIGGFSGRSQLAHRIRPKRVIFRDILHLLEQERYYSHSLLLYRSYLK